MNDEMRERAGELGARMRAGYDSQIAHVLLAERVKCDAERALADDLAAALSLWENEPEAQPTLARYRKARR